MSFTKIDNNNIAPTGVTAGSYTNANITVNESGQITSASNGVAGTGGGGGGGTGLQHTTYTYTANGSTTTFAATSGITVHTVLVILDGVTQMPTTDYTVSGSNVIFTSAPPANSVIQIRVLGDVASSGGGPKISNIAITDSNWDALDDTAVDIAGGYIKITGTGFVSGCLAYFNQTAAASISFVSSTELRISTGALAASTYVLYVINPDGGVAISVPGVTFSATPAWQTASSLSDQYDGVVITLSLVAQDATSYTLVSGSLPPGLSLNTSTGAITGTVVGVTVDTTYTFTVRATDAQNQDSPRTFTVSIIVSDPYFNRTTLLLSGSALSANTVIRDSSTNNFNLTVAGDARASNFSPYGTGWSVYFDGSGDYLNAASNAAFAFGTGNFTIEAWIFPTSTTSYRTIFTSRGTAANSVFFGLDTGTLFPVLFTSAAVVTSSVAVTLNSWNHVALVRNSGTSTIYVNGVSGGSASNTTDYTATNCLIGIENTSGQYPWFGYISDLRIVKGTAVYTTAFTPPIAPLTSVANTSLLTCNANRFLDSSANNFAITRNGDARVVSFNPFGITNTGVNGSMYFDGTGDLLTVPTSSVFNLGTGDFTIEFWAYLDPYVAQSSSSYWAEIIGINVGASDSNSVIGTVGIWQSDGTGTSTVAGEYTVIISGSSTNQQRLHSGVSGYYKWTHVALTRSSGTFTLWQDGISKATASVTADINRNDYVKIGRSINSGIKGNVSNIRVIKGTAVYTSNFTPQTQPLTAITNTQLLTLQYDQPYNNHTFLDSSSNQFVITRSGNTTQGTFSPFSQAGWSVYINNGTSSQIRISDNAALRIGTSAFNIEAWVYPTSFSEPFYILRKRVNGNVGAGTWAFTVATNGSVSLEQVQGPATIAQTSAGLVALNTWTHVAVSRDSSNNVRIFVNGTIQTTATSSYNFNDASNPISLLCDYDGRNASSIGYASNLRFVIGSAIYTTNFTPATSNLTSSSQGAVAADVKILTFQDNRFRDASTNNFTITISGSPSVQAFSPFAPTAVYSPVTHGGSAYFDGTGDYLNFTDTANILDMGGVAASVEAWVYPLGNSGNHHIISKSGGDPNWSTTNGIYWIMRIVTGQFGCEFRNGTVVNVITGGTATLNTWHHVAIATDTSNNIALFVNGVRVGTATNAITKPTSRTLIQIADFAGASVAVNAYISGICFKTSTSAYAPTSSTITIPTAPVTATTNTQLLLNFTDAGIIDSTGRTVIETVADTKSTSVVSKFAGGSMYFDGTGDAINIRSSDLLTFGTGDWTVEFWVYHTSVSGQQTYLGDTGGATSGPYIYKDSSHKVGLYYSSQILTGTTTIAVNTWYYIALSRASGTVRLFINGIQETSASDTTNLSVAIQWVGGDTLPSGYLSGYMNDIRVTKGYARYTSNFTPPTAPHRLK